MSDSPSDDAGLTASAPTALTAVSESGSDANDKVLGSENLETSPQGSVNTSMLKPTDAATLQVSSDAPASSGMSSKKRGREEDESEDAYQSDASDSGRGTKRVKLQPEQEAGDNDTAMFQVSSANEQPSEEEGNRGDSLIPQSPQQATPSSDTSSPAHSEYVSSAQGDKSPGALSDGTTQPSSDDQSDDGRHELAGSPRVKSSSNQEVDERATGNSGQRITI